MRDEAPKRLRASSFKAHEYVRHVTLPACHYNKSTLTTHTTRGLTRVSYSVQACSGTRSPPRASVSFPPSHYPDACCYRKLHSGRWLRYASSSPPHKLQLSSYLLAGAADALLLDRDLLIRRSAVPHLRDHKNKTPQARSHSQSMEREGLYCLRSGR